TSGPSVGFDEPVERVERLPEPPGRGRQNRLFSQLVQQPAGFFSELGCSSKIAGEELDKNLILADHGCECEPSAAIRELGTFLHENHPRLVEATEPGQCK